MTGDPRQGATRPLRLRFVTSAARVEQLPARDAEVAMVGRSNVGKSSLINAIAGAKGLARVSNTPGRTQLVNLFDVDDAPDGAGNVAVVDLPGYGYAKVPDRVRREWPAMIEGYLIDRPSLVHVFVLVDGAIGPTPLDVRMLEWARELGLAHTVVATKADKVKASKRVRRQRELAAGCRLDPGDVVWASATTGAGIDLLRSLVRSHLFLG